MSSDISLWLERALELEGVTAAAVCLPDGTAVSKAKMQQLDTAAVEHAVKCAADVFAVLRVQKIPTQWLRFEFDTAHFYCATNPEKICLGFLIHKGGQPAGAERHEQFLAQFASQSKSGE